MPLTAGWFCPDVKASSGGVGFSPEEIGEPFMRSLPSDVAGRSKSYCDRAALVPAGAAERLGFAGRGEPKRVRVAPGPLRPMRFRTIWRVARLTCQVRHCSSVLEPQDRVAQARRCKCTSANLADQTSAMVFDAIRFSLHPIASSIAMRLALKRSAEAPVSFARESFRTCSSTVQ